MMWIFTGDNMREITLCQFWESKKWIKSLTWWCIEMYHVRVTAAPNGKYASTDSLVHRVHAHSRLREGRQTVVTSSSCEQKNTDIFLSPFRIEWLVACKTTNRWKLIMHCRSKLLSNKSRGFENRVTFPWHLTLVHLYTFSNFTHDTSNSVFNSSNRNRLSHFSVRTLCSLRQRSYLLSEEEHRQSTQMHTTMLPTLESFSSCLRICSITLWTLSKYSFTLMLFLPSFSKVMMQI